MLSTVHFSYFCKKSQKCDKNSQNSQNNNEKRCSNRLNIHIDFLLF